MAKYSDIIGTVINGQGQKFLDYHGIESAGTISATRSGAGTLPSPYAYSIAISSINYWYQGDQYINTNPVSVDLATALGTALIANKLYYIYFNNSSGILAAGTSINLKTLVPVCMIYTNSDISAVTITKETHSHTRNLDWHINAHRTIGTRYYNGLDLVAPTTTNDDTLSLTTGLIYDEDIAITITNPSTSRVWYQISSGIYTWADSSLPYAGSTNDPTWLDTDDYTLKSVADNNYVCEWIYATNDIDRPIYIIPTQAATAHSTITAARNELQPILSGLIQELAPEWKLIYRFIYKGDGEFQEATDYRKVSSLPSGAIAAIASSSVTLIPTGNISSTNVQAAIEELDTEKQEILVSGTNIKTINSTSLIGSGDITINRLTPTSDTATSINITKADGTSPVLTVDTLNHTAIIKSNQTSATLSAELITNAVDMDFSGAGNWVGTNWTVGSGVITHTAGANALSLANTNLTTPIVAGANYQLVFTINTTTAGTLTPSVGGKNAVVIGKQFNSEIQTMVINAVTNTNPLTFTPDATWAGTIDNVSLKRITPVTATIQLKNSAGNICNTVTVNGTSNVFIGIDSGQDLITGSYNSSQGHQSLYSLTTGSYNSSQGYQSLYSLTTGNGNSSQGYQSLYSLTTGIVNNSQGHQSLYSLTTGSYNNSQGYQSLYSLITGSYNVALGSFSGRYQANGTTALTDPEKSIYIGANTRGFNNSDDNTIVIGYNAIGLGANTVVLGNSSITKTALRGNIGIGTTTPTSQLDIQSAQPTSATLSSELITNAVDMDFSGAGNWVGTNWTVGSGVITHTAGANAVSLANTFLTEAIVAGANYQLVFTINTTTVGTLIPSVGGKIGVILGTATGSITPTMVINAVTNTNPLTFTPDATWAGTIDNISLKRITPVTASIQLKNSAGNICNTVTVNGATNNFNGVSSGQNRTTGNNNISQGYQSLYSITSGGDNCCYGYRANAEVTTGNANCSYGSYSLAGITIGISNCAYGYVSLAGISSGNNNVSIGSSSGFYQADGITSLTQANNSVYIGYGARGYNNADNNTIVIGYNTIGKGANQTVLGNSSITNTTIGGNILPYVADTYDIGSSTLQYDDIYATNATIQTSDARLKEDVVELYISTPFLEKLRPVSFKWKDYEVPAETRVDTVQAKDENGNLLFDEIIEINEVPRQELVHKKDDDGNLLYNTVTDIDENGVETTRQEPVMIEETIIEKVETTRQEPVMTTETVIVKEAYTKTHVRKHCGLIAQEVEQAILDIGMTTEDFAALCYDSETDRYSVRYVELIPVLIRGWQDQQSKIKELETRLAALENK